jgi:hypothetical protein
MLYLPFSSGAWGVVGHKLTAKIAYTQLSPAIKDSLKVYLGETTIEEASVWMDEIRSDPSNDSLKPFHYINMEKGESYNPDSTHNIIGELDRIIRELKDRGKYDKEHITVDLKILIHLIGDLHQPMHNGYGSDRGGNSVSVFVAGGGSNLHRVWDTDLLESYIMTEPMDWASTAKYSKEQLAEIRKVNILGWMNESRKYLIECYDFKGQDIDRKYVKRAIPIVEERLLFGGIRLGKLLRDIFHS